MENGEKAQSSAAQAVIFDLDGVLLDSEWLAFQSWREYASRYGGVLKDADFPGMIGLTAKETARYVMDHTEVVFDIDESSAWAWQRVLERLREGTEPLPGSVELIRRLSARGCPLAIASNSIASYIDDALAGLGLLNYFPVRVSIEQVVQGKPAPDVYLRAAARLSKLPSRCLAIEDSRVGVQAAVAAGMRVIAVPGMRDQQDGFNGAWRVYPSLQKVAGDLDWILSGNG